MIKKEDLLESEDGNRGDVGFNKNEIQELVTRKQSRNSPLLGSCSSIILGVVFCIYGTTALVREQNVTQFAAFIIPGLIMILWGTREL